MADCLPLYHEYERIQEQLRPEIREAEMAIARAQAKLKEPGLDDEQKSALIETILEFRAKAAQLKHQIDEVYWRYQECENASLHEEFRLFRQSRIDAKS